MIKEIKHIFQPRKGENSKTCGQHCVAMATGVDVQLVINICKNYTGRSKGTTIKDLYKLFAVLGHVVSDKLVDTECKYAIIAYHHWALKVDKLVYDSSIGVYCFSEIHKLKVRKVRFLELPSKMFEI